MIKKMPYSALVLVLMLLLILPQTDVHALALSRARLNSTINQPLNATIELISATSAELDSLNAFVSRISNASTERGSRPQLMVELVRMEKGNSYLKITTKENVREPVISFLLELGWSTGRIQREYSLLLNLPH